MELEEILAYYNEHSRAETLKHFNLSSTTFYRIIKGYKKPKDKIKHINNRTHESYIEGGKKSASTQKQNWESKTEVEKGEWKQRCQDIQLNLPDAIKKRKEESSRETYEAKSDLEKRKINQQRSVTCKKHWESLTTSEKEEKISEQITKTQTTCMERYGVLYPCMREEARLKGNNSKPNQEFEDLLILHNINFSREFVLGKYSYDFKVDNILIEINPYYTHNSTYSPFDREPLEKRYHYNKTKFAIENGYRCINVWDWDNATKIVKSLQKKDHLFARNLIIKEIKDEKIIADFENEYHFQGYCRGQKICIALYLDNILIELMTFGTPRYNKKYEYELLRLCTNSSYTVTGGAERLFNYFKQTYTPASIISYCDNSKFSGEIYSKLGFHTDDAPNPSKHWYNYKTKEHITDNLLRQRGFDQLFDEQNGKGTSNRDLMISHGFVEIYDCGQQSYYWEK